MRLGDGIAAPAHIVLVLGDFLGDDEAHGKALQTLGRARRGELNEAVAAQFLVSRGRAVLGARAQADHMVMKIRRRLDRSVELDPVPFAELLLRGQDDQRRARGRADHVAQGVERRFGFGDLGAAGDRRDKCHGLSLF